MEKELNFQCPGCGSDRLGFKETGIVEFTSVYLTRNGFQTGKTEVIDREGETWQCQMCGYVLKDESGNEVSSEEEALKWLKKNCC